MLENEQLIELADEFLRHYCKHRGIENAECEALENVRKQAEAAKEDYKMKRDLADKPEIGTLPSRVLKNRRATAAAKVRDEVFKRELKADVRRFEMKCVSLFSDLQSKRLQLHRMRQINHKLKVKLRLLQHDKKENKVLIAQSLEERYEEERRSGFVCPSLFGNATDLVRYGGALPLFSQE